MAPPFENFVAVARHSGLGEGNDLKALWTNLHSSVQQLYMAPFGNFLVRMIPKMLTEDEWDPDPMGRCQTLWQELAPNDRAGYEEPPGWPRGAELASADSGDDSNGYSVAEDEQPARVAKRHCRLPSTGWGTPPGAPQHCWQQDHVEELMRAESIVAAKEGFAGSVSCRHPVEKPVDTTDCSERSPRELGQLQAQVIPDSPHKLDRPCDSPIPRGVLAHSSSDGSDDSEGEQVVYRRAKLIPRPSTPGQPDVPQPAPVATEQQDAARSKGPWSATEDAQLLQAVTKLGVPTVSADAKSRIELDGYHRWTDIAKDVPGRTRKQCRERWRYHLDPAVNREPWCDEEDEKLLRAYDELGSKWVEIARRLPGRTDNACVTNSQSPEGTCELIGSRLLAGARTGGTSCQVYGKPVRLTSATQLGLRHAAPPLKQQQTLAPSRRRPVVSHTSQYQKQICQVNAVPRHLGRRHQKHYQKVLAVVL